MTEKKKKPEFWIEFNSFASFGNIVEASIILSPEWDIHHVMNMLHGEDTARVLHLVFTRKEKDFGRKYLSLKEEWKQETGESK